MKTFREATLHILEGATESRALVSKTNNNNQVKSWAIASKTIIFMSWSGEVGSLKYIEENAETREKRWLSR